MTELLRKAGMTFEVLKDSVKRTAAIDESNARAGGLRALMREGKLEIAETHAIPARVSASEVTRYLQFIGAGKRAPILFAAGRATRMKLPSFFDSLGIAGLTGNILSRINSLGESNSELHSLVEAASQDKPRQSGDLSLLQRQLLQYQYQTKRLLDEHPAAGVTLRGWLEKASFVVVANEANHAALSHQLAAVGYGGLKPENVLLTVQGEVGGLEVLPDGTTRPFDTERWPEGHGKPFMDLRAEGLL